MTPAEQENVVLSIVAEGEPILAIGNWEGAVLRLAARGLLAQRGGHYVITPAGRRAFQAMEEDESPVIDGEAEEWPRPS